MSADKGKIALQCLTLILPLTSTHFQLGNLTCPLRSNLHRIFDIAAGVPNLLVQRTRHQAVTQDSRKHTGIGRGAVRVPWTSQRECCDCPVPISKRECLLRDAWPSFAPFDSGMGGRFGLMMKLLLGFGRFGEAMRYDARGVAISWFGAVALMFMVECEFG